MRVSAIDESHVHTMEVILKESYAHEKLAITKYYKLLDFTSYYWAELWLNEEETEITVKLSF